MSESFVDKELQCRYCPSKFVFTAGEQRYFKRHGLTHEPTRCLPCREKKKTDPAFVDQNRKREFVK